MKGLIINVLVGAGLFAGGLVAALAATGRLNHDGVANIPVLSGFFPEPEKTAPEKTEDDMDEGEGAGEGAGAGRQAPAEPGAAEPATGAPRHKSIVKEASHEPGQDPMPARGPGSRPLKRGRSIHETGEQQAQGGGHVAAGHGEDEQGGAGQEPGDQAHSQDQPIPPTSTQHGAEPHAAERDFQDMEAKLNRDRKTRYSPGGYFRFDGMPSGITPEQLNEAWTRVQEVMADLERRGKRLDLREKELREFADDIARRQAELGRERVELLNLQLKLDERIDRFKEQVKLVRTDEVAGLKRNAKTMASFEPSKAAELIQEQWRLEGGEDEVLKMLEFMERDAVDQIIAVLPNAMIREVLQKRLQVSRENVPSASPGK